MLIEDGKSVIVIGKDYYIKIPLSEVYGYETSYSIRNKALFVVAFLFLWFSLFNQSLSFKNLISVLFWGYILFSLLEVKVKIYGKFGFLELSMSKLQEDFLELLKILRQLPKEKWD